MKKQAIVLADNRPALVGQMLVQLRETNDKVFDEVIIFDTGLSEHDKTVMQGIMPCRFIPYASPLPSGLLASGAFKRFSLIMFARYEMFRLLDEYSVLVWLDTDMVIQGSLVGLLQETKGWGFSILCEDPVNKSARNVDYMSTNFYEPPEGYDMNTYLYCTGLIVFRDCLKQKCDYAAWCYEKTAEWANILKMPDQGVINALIQEFRFPVKPLGNNGQYGCFPYVGRDCGSAVLVHAWGTNKFWNNFYLNKKFPVWEKCYQKWLDLGGSAMLRDIPPEVSVVIPVYKPDLHYFKQSLDSLLTQMKVSYEEVYTNFEIIIVAEPFNEEEITSLILGYDDPRIKLVFNEVRRGIAASLNQGLRLAKGKYIARIDDDDIAVPVRLAKQAEYLNAHEDIILCTSDYVYFGDMNEGRNVFDREMARAWSVLTCPFDHPTVMFRREFFADNNLFYDEERGYVEDWELWQRAFRAGMTVGCIKEVLLQHRWHNGSAGQNDNTVQMMNRMIQSSFAELGVDVLDSDCRLLSPWSGRVEQEDAYKRLEKYFDEALENNKRLKLYDNICLKRAFYLRLREAATGILDELVFSVREQNEPFTANSEEWQTKGIKGLIKKLLKPLYQPFRHRYEDRLIDIQKSGWRAEGQLDQCIDRLNSVIDCQQRQLEDMQKSMEWLYAKFQYLANIVVEQAQASTEITDARIRKAEQGIKQTTDARIWQAEQGINEKTDARIWQAEQGINEKTDARIWQAEQDINEKTDARIWQAEQGINEKTDARIWQAEQSINQTTDARIWQAEQSMNQTTDARIWKAEKNIIENRNEIVEPILDETHRHIDFTYRDIMVALQQQQAFLPANNVTLETDYPIAYESLDHLYPHGTIRDNTRYPRFVEKCEELMLPKRNLAFLDLGCSGGGMVLEAALRGHLSMGLEGSDCSKKEQRAEWRLLGDRLQTCDITKPFYLRRSDNEIQKFDVITAWEVLEHIAEADLPQLFENIRKHLTDEGYFVGSIANWDDIDPVTGVNWHVTVHPYDWWAEKFSSAGFRIKTEDFNTIDLARGGYNHPQCYLKPAEVVYTETSFHIAVQK